MGTIKGKVKAPNKGVNATIFFSIYLFGLSTYYAPLILLITAFIFGNYERSMFKLSSNLVKRVNPLQPWPSPIKARFSTASCPDNPRKWDTVQ